MSKYKIGDKVWVRGFYEGKRPPGDHYIRVMLDDRPQLVIIRSSQIKPDVTFKWSPAKAKKKARKK